MIKYFKKEADGSISFGESYPGNPVMAAMGYQPWTSEEEARGVMTAWNHRVYFIDEAPAKPAEVIQAEFTDAIQKRLDVFAANRGYDGILSACTYATSKIAKFAAEGQAAVELRDATWAAGYALLAEYMAAGTIPAWREVEARLPALQWPEDEA